MKRTEWSCPDMRVKTDGPARELFAQIHEKICSILGRKPEPEDILRLSSLVSGAEGIRFKNSLCAEWENGQQGPAITLTIFYRLAYQFGWLPDQAFACEEWVGTVGLKDSEPGGFEHVLKGFFADMLEMAGSDTSDQVINSACWVSPAPLGEESLIEQHPIYFQDIRDIAAEEGWINLSEWIGPKANSGSEIHRS